jgi:hypothetical protein
VECTSWHNLGSLDLEDKRTVRNIVKKIKEQETEEIITLLVRDKCPLYLLDLP